MRLAVERVGIMQEVIIHTVVFLCILCVDNIEINMFQNIQSNHCLYRKAIYSRTQRDYFVRQSDLKFLTTRRPIIVARSAVKTNMSLINRSAQWRCVQPAVT